jgi:ribosomal protein S11
MNLKLSTTKTGFLQIFKRFVFSVKKKNTFQCLGVTLNVLLFLTYNFNLKLQQNNYFFLINYFKLFFKNCLQNKMLNKLFFKCKAFGFSIVGILYPFGNAKNYFYHLFSIYLHFFYVLRILFSLKNKCNIFFKENKIPFVLYNKLYFKFMIFSTFSILLKKFFYLLKLRVATYKKRLLNVLNCYIRFTRHNIFITITSALNVPILISSSGKSGYGGKTKFKVSSQAAAKSASSVIKILSKKKLPKKLGVFIVSNRLFDKRIKSILSVFSNKGFKIPYIVPQLQRHVGGVRQKKIRRV